MEYMDSFKAMREKKQKRNFTLSPDIIAYIDILTKTYEASREVENAIRISPGFQKFKKERKHEN